MTEKLDIIERLRQRIGIDGGLLDEAAGTIAELRQAVNIAQHKYYDADDELAKLRHGLRNLLEGR
jgi:hypothetical protein